MQINELILYRNLQYGESLKDMAFLIEHYADNFYNKEDLRSLFFECYHNILERSANYGFEGNLWHTYLTFLLINSENAYSTACEMYSETTGSINEIVLHDFAIFKQLFDYDFANLEMELEITGFSILQNYQQEQQKKFMLNRQIRNQICELSRLLGQVETIAEFKNCLTRFYQRYGVGKLGLHKAFRVEQIEGTDISIVPIRNIAHVQLDDLVGYQHAKDKLLANTVAFIEGRKANNCLLYGDSGTGKSSSVKAILNQYYDQGLRMIELYRHQYQYLNNIIAQIKNRNYKFIIYMDDLSFEEFETEYKYLKAVIEGGLEKKPDNVLIYATSNRRHLVRETFRDKADRDEELHTNDTVQEKLSLAARFGVSIYFGSPGKKEFEQIVLGLAKANGISLPEEELLAMAHRWELSHGGRSGRTAQQFIDYFLGSILE